MQDGHTNGAIGVILAGGSGLRFQDSLPKQFHNLAGKPVIAHTIEAMARHRAISEVYVVYPQAHDKLVKGIVEKLTCDKPLRLVIGGATRQASTRAAIRAVRDGCLQNRKILFHDAVRPFLTRDIISRCLDALDTFDAVDTVVPTADTIVTLDESRGTLERIPTRSRLRRGQTPQGFWLDAIADAYERLDDAQLGEFTDDCGVFIACYPDNPIAAVDGHDDNIKITSPLDMFLAEQLIYMGKAKATLRPTLVERKSVAVLFGGSSGLGLATAQRLGDLGWQVEVASRSNGVDVRHEDAVAKFLATAEEKHGRIDLVINFAGLLRIGRLDEMSLQQIEEVVATNLMGSFVIARASQPYLQKTRGHLMLTSSSSYYRGRENSAAYSASKAAVVNLTQALADEWNEDGITVSCIVPRRADTPMRRNAFPNEDQASNLKPERVADAVVDLYLNQTTGMIKHIY
jgi:2-C-methyl-D-erythritol 4-phosphate cytidylyltransferase